MKEPVELLCDGVEAVIEFSYLGDKLNATGGCEVTVTARTRIGWMKFRECSELFKDKRFSLKMKGKIYKSCVRSAILYEVKSGVDEKKRGNFEKGRKSDD